MSLRGILKNASVRGATVTPTLPPEQPLLQVATEPTACLWSDMYVGPEPHPRRMRVVERRVPGSRRALPMAVSLAGDSPWLCFGSKTLKSSSALTLTLALRCDATKQVRICFTTDEQAPPPATLSKGCHVSWGPLPALKKMRGGRGGSWWHCRDRVTELGCEQGTLTYRITKLYNPFP